MKSSASLTALLVSFALSAAAPSALALPYAVAGGSVVANTGSGLEISTSVAGTLPGFSFSLNDGQAETFNFFRIWTDEAAVNLDDLFPKTITATLNFSTPANSAAVVGATVTGTIGLVSWGSVSWGSPVVVNAFDRSFEVALTDATFNGNWGTNFKPGEANGAWVKATVTQLNASNAPAVSEGGSTLLLLGAGLSLIGFINRRRRA
jgi:hypothetical protein